MGAFLVVVVALALIGVIRRDWAQTGTSLILIANWVSCTTVVYLTNDYYPVLFFIVADYMSMLGIFLIRERHWQSAIMAVYGLQLISHAAYGLSKMDVRATYYGWLALSYLGWVQAALVGGWIAHDTLGRWLSSNWCRIGVASRASSYLAREKTR